MHATFLERYVRDYSESEEKSRTREALNLSTDADNITIFFAVRINLIYKFFLAIKIFFLEGVQKKYLFGTRHLTKKYLILFCGPNF